MKYDEIQRNTCNSTKYREIQRNTTKHYKITNDKMSYSPPTPHRPLTRCYMDRTTVRRFGTSLRQEPCRTRVTAQQYTEPYMYIRMDWTGKCLNGLDWRTYHEPDNPEEAGTWA